MTTVTKNLIPAKYAENSQTTQYTATNVKARIDAFTVTNPTASAATITINKVPPAGTAGDSNAIVKTKSIAAGETYVVYGIIGQVLESGGFISTLAGTASALVIHASGVEVT